MILFALIGWAVQAFAGVTNALILGVFAGMIVANFVPARGACPLPPREPR
ncbi:MAG: hypothetical protein H6838_03625 [Planctomycetes bacterium]|nr:hypothetical protein [Planctomycetota bacterium]MCB9884554.1 hypothetical protein [Planctomycetota bacterium]